MCADAPRVKMNPPEYDTIPAKGATDGPHSLHRADKLHWLKKTGFETAGASYASPSAWSFCKRRLAFRIARRLRSDGFS